VYQRHSDLLLTFESIAAVAGKLRTVKTVYDRTVHPKYSNIVEMQKQVRSALCIDDDHYRNLDWLMVASALLLQTAHCILTKPSQLNAFEMVAINR
jgi:hypothetical protein